MLRIDGGAVVRELLELNRYLHDFTAAMWVSGSILIWLICSETRPSMKMMTEDMSRSMDMLVKRCWVRKVYR